jgi:hypothetical protein
MRVDDVADNGPGTYCSPRHRMPCNSIKEGFKCVGLRGEQFLPGPTGSMPFGAYGVPLAHAWLCPHGPSACVTSCIPTSEYGR